MQQGPRIFLPRIESGEHYSKRSNFVKEPFGSNHRTTVSGLPGMVNCEPPVPSWRSARSLSHVPLLRATPAGQCRH